MDNKIKVQIKLTEKTSAPLIRIVASAIIDTLNRYDLIKLAYQENSDCTEINIIAEESD